MGRSGRSIRVLHVDDDGRFAETAAEFLERGSEALEVETETSADDALDRLDEETVDCVVSDYEMPGKDGLELLRAVRERDPRLPFILFTGKGSEAVASEAISAGVTDYLRKERSTDRYELLANRIENAVERREAERERAELERRHREKSNLLDQLFAQIPANLYLKDAEGRHRRVSDEMLENVDRSESELLGKTDREIWSGDHGRAAYEDDMRVIEDGDPVRNVEEAVDGGDRTLLTSKVPWYGEDGEVRGLIGISRDVTERKESERRLERQNDRLEEFVSIVSHDLRNPLNVATGRLELAQAECDSEALDRVERAHERMEALIADLLELAREGETARDLEPVRLDAAVERCRETVETGDADVVAKSDVRLRADAGRLSQLLENLVGNAVEHGGEGPEVHVGELSGGAGFYVADDGPGIPADERDRVFDAGYTTSESGTGFGLSIVEEIAEAHDWDVRVTDGEDGGARFEITGVDVRADE